MPHPKNRLKLTGDTHLPDLRDLMEQDEDIELVAVRIEAPERVYADGWVPAATGLAPGPQPAGPVATLERKVEALPARWPWLAIGAGMLFGWLVARMLRR